MNSDLQLLGVVHQVVPALGEAAWFLPLAGARVPLLHAGLPPLHPVHSLTAGPQPDPDHVYKNQYPNFTT